VRRACAAIVQFFNSVCRGLLAAQPNAGGEDVGYFALGKRVRLPPLAHALWRCPCKGRHAPQRRFSERSICVGSLKADIASSPACQFKCRMRKLRHGGGEDVCYFVVHEGPEGWAQQHHAFPANPNMIRGEDRCYFVCNTRGRGFESRPAFHAPVAQRIERCRPAKAGWRLSNRPFPDRGSLLREIAGGEECCYFGITRLEVRVLPEAASLRSSIG
jgi:hypothetical protein